MQRAGILPDHKGPGGNLLSVRKGELKVNTSEFYRIKNHLKALNKELNSAETDDTAGRARRPTLTRKIPHHSARSAADSSEGPGEVTDEFDTERGLRGRKGNDMSLRNSFQQIKLGKAVLVVGLILGGFAFSYHTNFLNRQLNHQLSELKEENNTLRHQNGQLEYINNLAVEFSMDPFIVTLVDHYSRKFLKKDNPEWRLMKTPEFMTYIMLSLIYVESRGDPNSIGDHGKARGLTQIWVSTARGYGDVSARQLLDPETNISYSFKHFHYLLTKYKGNLALALYAWNRGHGTVDRLLLYGQSPQNNYGKKVYEAALVNNGGIWGQ